MYSRQANVNTLVFILICVLIQIILFSIIFFSTTNSFRLEKVVILSRHNVRSPLSKNLEKITQKKWPQWKEKPGYLTDRGFLLEGFMGKYFSDWLHKEGALPDTCPSEKEFYVYANSVQRTMYSAEAFVKNAFPNCNITIHKSDSETDPIFSPYIHNSSAIFKDIALREMKYVLNHLNLTTSYNSIENILDYNNSELCKTYNECDLAIEKNNIDIIVSKKPKVSGPLKIGNEAIDAFLMSYYQGIPLKEIGWGKLNNMKQWGSILDITAGYHNVTFNTTHVARDVSKPLLNYMKNIFLNTDIRVTLLMGHDANINVLLNAMLFKPYNLLESFVLTPVGGKIVFQKWYNIKNDKYYLKIDYVYQTNDQLRNAEVLTLQNSPKFLPMELKHCVIDENNFCLWDDFEKFLKSL